MELVYLWVEKYKNIENQGFNFSPRFTCNYENGTLTINKKEPEPINIFPSNINVTAIVGENGSGKSTILELLKNDYGIEHEQTLFFVYYDVQNKQLIFPGLNLSPLDFNNHAKFEYKGIKNKEDSNGNFFDEDRILLELKPISEDEKVKNHIEVFNLQNLYNEHKDIVSEILIKSEIYNESYIEELMQNYEGTLFKNEEDLLRLIFGGYISDEDLGKRPLSKLTKDILEQLEII